LYNIESHVIWKSEHNPIIIENNVNIYENGILEIRAGTEIFIVENSAIEGDPAGHYPRDPKFTIYGTLLCKGKSKSKILFRGLNTPQPYGEFIIYDNKESVIEWTEFGEIWFWGGENAKVSYSKANLIGTDEIEYVGFVGNFVDVLSVFGGEGIIEKNRITEGLSVSSDSTIIKNNIIRGSTRDKAAIKCQGVSHAQITNNIIANNKAALFIRSSSPKIHKNNIVDNVTNVVLYHDWPETIHDTLDVTDNWWGEIDSISIASKFEYNRSDTQFGKVIDFTPFALQPFEIDTLVYP